MLFKEISLEIRFCKKYQLILLFVEKVTPTAKLAAEKGVVFVVPRFRLGPLGFLPRLLLNDTSDVIKKSADFTVEST